MNKTPTPRTDTCAKNIDQSNFEYSWKDDFEEFAWVPTDFACQLECELTAVTKQRNEWKAKFIQQNKDLGCEMMDPNGTIWDYAKKLQTQLPAITKQLDEYKLALQSADNHNHEIGTKLEIVTEQRDEAREEINSVRRTLSKNGEAVGNGEYNFTIIEIVENLIRSKHYFVRKSDALERERDEAREQRDRLAEAMQTIICIYEKPDKGCIPCSSDMYDVAFQSLKI